MLGPATYMRATLSMRTPRVHMNEGHLRLLAAVGRLHERYEARRQRPFNLFTVLRTSTDEVNLHSRFLHALLEHRQSPSGKPENLSDFLCQVVRVPEFDLAHVRVSREDNNIDLLIADGRQAVVIENKILARDREQQLQRYHQHLVGLGYQPSSIKLVYLTLDGREPSGQSIGTLSCRLVSYADTAFQCWLRRCQQRAVDQPPLRESIAQYLDLARRLTGTDHDHRYMMELEEILRQDDNLILASDLAQAAIETKVKLVVDLWKTIDDTLKRRIPDLAELVGDGVHDADDEAVRRNIAGRQRREAGIGYRFNKGASICVAAISHLWFGVYCRQSQHPELYASLKGALDSTAGPHQSDEWAPWWRYPQDGTPNLSDLDADSLRFLLSGPERHSQWAEQIADGLEAICQKLKDEGLWQPTE